MANYTINEIPNEASDTGNSDYAVIYQSNKTKKITILNLFKNLVKKAEVATSISTTNENPITAKAVSSLLTISASSATITNAPPLQNGTTIRFFFTSQITGSDDTTALAISYNGTSYNVKVTVNGALKDFTANAVATEQTRELSKGGKKSVEEGEEESGTKSGTRATVTTYVYCQAYTTMEMMFDGTQFIIMGNPVVISNADYTIYADGASTYTKTITVRTGDTLTYGLYVTAYLLTQKEQNEIFSIVVLKTANNHIPTVFCDNTSKYLYIWTEVPNVDVTLKLTFRG